MLKNISLMRAQHVYFMCSKHFYPHVFSKSLSLMWVQRIFTLMCAQNISLVRSTSFPLFVPEMLFPSYSTCLTKDSTGTCIWTAAAPCPCWSCLTRGMGSLMRDANDTGHNPHWSAHCGWWTWSSACRVDTLALPARPMLKSAGTLVIY